MEVKNINLISVIESYQHAVYMADGCTKVIKQNPQTLEFSVPFWAQRVDVE